MHILNVRSYRQRNRAMSSVQTYTLTPEQFSISGSLFDTALKWDALIKARETPRFFLLYISPRWAHFIPKSAITSPQDLSAIRALIRQRLGSNAHLFSGT